MSYQFADHAANVYMIDTNMFDFPNYNAAYLIKGRDLVLIDTGLPNQYEMLRKGIHKHGFSFSDISSIFITHEHPDHCGNVGHIIRENPNVKVFCHPRTSIHLIDPSIEDSKRKQQLLPQMAARFGTMLPVPSSKIQELNDGDSFDLGGGERLKIIFTPGHQPGGLVILAEKNMGLFINDLVGCFLPDADNFFLIFS